MKRLHLLITGLVSREEVAAWAMAYILFDNPQIYPEVKDAAVWKALVSLSGADLQATDRVYSTGKRIFPTGLMNFVIWRVKLMESQEQPPKMYTDIAAWWPLLSSPENTQR